MRKRDRMPSPAVVLDTNVFVAAGFNPRSASAKIVNAVKEGQVRMVWNDATRREIERIMHQIPAAPHPERFAETIASSRHWPRPPVPS
jgi:predicted nucleic acid-binding protein